MKISKKYFGTVSDGTVVSSFTLAEENGIQAEILDYGVTVRSLHVPDQNGNLTDIVLGYDSLDEYRENDGYFGAVVGRFANRIAKASFVLNGVEYSVAANDGENHLHGGIVGFDKRVWNTREVEQGVEFSLLSLDGEEGYPGNLSVKVTVTLKENCLQFKYHAVSDEDTILNLTNHSYFNLNGSGDIYGHFLTLPADTFTLNDDACVPTGKIVPVAGTAMDFRAEHTIGERIDCEEPCVKLCNGYDSNYILKKNEAIIARADKSGIVMKITTDQPGVQFYAGNLISKRKGKRGQYYDRRSGFCLETQHFPDSIHHLDWPSCILKAGEAFESTTDFIFTINGK